MAKGRILLVEDEALIRWLMAEILVEEQFEVIEAGNGEDAIALVDAGEGFDLLLTDVHMPGRLSGIDVARHARLRQPDLPVVFATGRSDALETFGELGPREAFMAKPFSPLETLGIVVKLLQIHGSRGA